MLVPGVGFKAHVPPYQLSSKLLSAFIW